jgi:cation diffusion facilitator family transporter
VLHLHGHSHEPASVDDPGIGTREGIRTVWIALGALGVTTLLQVVIVILSGSVALLADTVHNLGDFLNSIPLLVAFYLARRVATSRYTYGYGRAEDVAGVVIVASILFSAGYILWESATRLLEPQPIEALPWVAAAAVVGTIGNEAVAWFQIRTGRRIGSEALIADGLHARVDGLTSLAVLIAVAGVALGVPIVDPIVGLLIGVTILFIARDATMRIWYRLMDAVDPDITERLDQYASEVAGVARVRHARARWVGHALHADISVDAVPGADAGATTTAIRSLVQQHLRHVADVMVEVRPAVDASSSSQPRASSGSQLDAVLPPRYRDTSATVSAAPMGAVGLQYDAAGEVAWDEMWGGFCELALAGGAPHRGTLLEPVHEGEIQRDPERYAWVLGEIEKGIRRVTGLPVVRSEVAGWIGMRCDSDEMAIWLLRAIVVENVTVRREDAVLWFPAGPAFRLEREIKNVITVVAKTHHYWTEHVAATAGQ